MRGRSLDNPAGDVPDVEREVVALERTFYRHGLTSFVVPRRNLRSLPARALPLLGATIGVEVAWLATAGWAAPFRILLGVAVAPPAYRLVRRVMLRRVMRGRGDGAAAWLNYLWLSVFVGVVPGLGYVFGLPAGEVARFVLIQALLALFVLLGAAVGLVGAVLEAAEDLVANLVRSVPALLRTLPFLTLFSLVIFLTSETWQVFGAMSTARLGAVVAVFGVLGAIVLVARLPVDVEEIERQGNAEGPRLRTVQRRNIAVVVALQELVHILSVVVLMAVVFVVLGSLAIGDEVYRRWEVDPGPHAWRAPVLGDVLVVSAPLVQVSVVVAVVCGLSYTVSVLTDRVYRADLLERVSDDMSEMLRLRRRYLAVVRTAR